MYVTLIWNTKKRKKKTVCRVTYAYDTGNDVRYAPNTVVDSCFNAASAISVLRNDEQKSDWAKP